jgi:hypothetical protein
VDKHHTKTRHWLMRWAEAAGLKVGSDRQPKRQLGWLLDFVQDEKAIVDAKAKTLEGKVAELAYFTLPGRVDLRTRPLLSVAELHEFAVSIRAGITKLVDSGSWNLRLPKNASPTSFVRTVQRDASGGAAVSRYSSDNLLVIARWRAADLVGAHLQKTRRCRRAGCARLFVANKRAEYCSHSCSHAERNERWREKKSEDKRREMRHEAYKRKVGREKGRAYAEKVRQRIRTHEG